jgi:hypothetical protein
MGVVVGNMLFADSNMLFAVSVSLFDDTLDAVVDGADLELDQPVNGQNPPFIPKIIFLLFSRE